MDKKQKLQHRNAMYTLAIVASVILLVALMGFIFLGRESEYIEGQAEADEYRVSSKVPGRIRKYYVSEGDWVKTGDTLVTLEAPDVEAKYTQVEAIRTAAEALNEKSHSPARIEVLQSAYEMWQKAVAGVDIARKTFERVERLYTEGVTTAQQRDEAQANLNAMIATEKAARWQYEMAQRGAQVEDKEITAAQVKEAEGGVAEVASYIDETVLTAPMEGQVSDIFPLQGELVGSGAPIMNITLMDRLWVSLNVREDHLIFFPVGEIFTAYAPGIDREVTLQVTRLKDRGTYAAWKATKVTGEYDLKTFEVKAIPVTPAKGLCPGMSVVVKLKRIKN
jgi:HlyD family secretion protein